MKSRMLSLGAFVLAAAGVVSMASADTYKVDPIHSMVVFQINHFGISNPYGIFRAPTGTVDVDADGVPSLDVSLPVAKLDMGNPKWESDIKSGSWFDVKQYPTINFKTTSVKKTGDNTYEATGDLTLHGVTKAITVTLTKSGEGKTPMGSAIGFDATFKINRSDFGMTTYKGPVGDQVTLMVNIEADKT